MARFIHTREFWEQYTRRAYPDLFPAGVTTFDLRNANTSSAGYDIYSAIVSSKRFGETEANNLITHFFAGLSMSFLADDYAKKIVDSAQIRFSYAGLPVNIPLGIATFGDFSKLVRDLNADDSTDIMTEIDDLFDIVETSSYTDDQKNVARHQLLKTVLTLDSLTDEVVRRQNSLNFIDETESAHNDIKTYLNSVFTEFGITPSNAAGSTPLQILAQNALDSVDNTLLSITTTRRPLIEAQLLTNTTFAPDGTPTSGFAKEMVDWQIELQTAEQTFYRTHEQVLEDRASVTPHGYTLGVAAELFANLYFNEITSDPATHNLETIMPSFPNELRMSYESAKTFVDGRMELYNSLRTQNGQLDAFVQLIKTISPNANLVDEANLSSAMNGFEELYNKVILQQGQLQSLMSEVLSIEAGKFDKDNINNCLAQLNNNILVDLFRTQDEASAFNMAQPKGAPLIGMGDGTKIINAMLFANRSRLQTQQERDAFKNQVIESLQTIFPDFEQSRFEIVFNECQSFVDKTSYNLATFRTESLNNELTLTPADVLAVQASPTFSIIREKADKNFPFPVGANDVLTSQIEFQRLIYAREYLKFNSDRESQEALNVLNNLINNSIQQMTTNGAVLDVHELNQAAVLRVVETKALDTLISQRNFEKIFNTEKANPANAGKTDDEIRQTIIETKRSSDPAFAAYSDEQIMESLVEPTEVATLKAEIFNDKRAELGDPALSDSEVEKAIAGEDAQRYIKVISVNGQRLEAHGDYGFAEMSNMLDSQKNREFNDIERKYFGFTPCGNPDLAYYKKEAARFAEMCKPGGLAEYYLEKAAWRGKWQQVDSQKQNAQGQGGSGGINISVNPNITVNPTMNQTTGDVNVNVGGSVGGKGGSGGGNGSKDPYKLIKNKIKMLYVLQDAMSTMLDGSTNPIKAGLVENYFLEKSSEVLEMVKSMGMTQDQLDEICEDAHAKYVKHNCTKVKTTSGEVSLKGIAKQQTEPADMISVSIDSSGKPVMRQGAFEISLEAGGDAQLTVDTANIDKATLPQNELILNNVLTTISAEDKATGTTITPADEDNIKIDAQTNLNTQKQNIINDAQKIAQEGKSL